MKPAISRRRSSEEGGSGWLEVLREGEGVVDFERGKRLSGTNGTAPLLRQPKNNRSSVKRAGSPPPKQVRSATSLRRKGPPPLLNERREERSHVNRASGRTSITKLPRKKGGTLGEVRDLPKKEGSIKKFPLRGKHSDNDRSSEHSQPLWKLNKEGGGTEGGLGGDFSSRCTNNGHARNGVGSAVEDCVRGGKRRWVVSFKKKGAVSLGGGQH